MKDKSERQKRRAFIFDLDGTLLDSMNVWAQIDVAFLAKRNIVMPADYANAVSHMRFEEAAYYTIERFRLEESAEALMREWEAMAYHAYSRTVELKPFAKEYLLALKSYGCALAIATSAKKELYEPALKRHGIFSLFDVICTTDEVGVGKNSPAVFYATAQRLKTAPENCILFDDVMAAIISAKETGMTVYGMYDEANHAHWESIQKLADGVLYDFRTAPLPDAIAD